MLRQNKSARATDVAMKCLTLGMTVYFAAYSFAVDHKIQFSSLGYTLEDKTLSLSTLLLENRLPGSIACLTNNLCGVA